MPVTYQIDKARSLIHTRCHGMVMFEEVMGHFQTLIDDPDCPPRLNVLLDLTESETAPESDQLRAVSAEIGRIQSAVKFNACAVVVSSDLLFGMSRMFVVFARSYFEATHVFRTFDSAEKWLETYRLPPA